MRTYWLLMLGMGTVFLALFGLVASLDVPLLTNPQPFLDRAGLWGAAAIGAGLLILDVFLPVPASLVMVAHGALFGLVRGTLVSLAGSMGGAALGFAVGRWGSASLHRWVPANERQRADELLQRWGGLAIIVTRPIPILAESVSILAGTSPLGFWRFLGAAFLGNFPACALYAATGATAARLDNAFLMFGLVLAVAALAWFAGRHLRRPPTPAPRSIKEP
jgi:uncharacterized membrane protein YdjX (TVP38/TMEM64 family)